MKKKTRVKKALEQVGEIAALIRQANAQARVDANRQLGTNGLLEQILDQLEEQGQANRVFAEAQEPLLKAAAEKLAAESEGWKPAKSPFPKQLFEAGNANPTIFDRIRSGEITGGTVNGHPFTFGKHEPIDAEMFPASDSGEKPFTLGGIDFATPLSGDPREPMQGASVDGGSVKPKFYAELLSYAQNIMPSLATDKNWHSYAEWLLRHRFGLNVGLTTAKARLSDFADGYHAGRRDARNAHNNRIVIADESRTELTDEQIKNHTGRILLIGSPAGPLGSFERIFKASAPSEVDDGLNEPGWSPLYPTTPEQTPTAPINTNETENK